MELADEIRSLKRDRNAVILAHYYQRPEIQEIADFTGDSLDLSRKAASAEADVIVFCGVKFMAETAKLISPGKTVLIPRIDAGCFMADMIEGEDVEMLRREHPKAKVVTYVNSTAEVKALTDVCCTSANALDIVESVESDEVIFLPDANLGSWVQSRSPKKLWLWKGFCNVHERISARDIEAARIAHPGAEILVHPECRPEVVALADRVLSTGQMLRHVSASGTEEFIIATEEGILHRLAKDNPGKRFYTAGSAKACVNMKKTSLADLRDSLLEMRHEIRLDPDIAAKARRPLDEMLARSR